MAKREQRGGFFRNHGLSIVMLGMFFLVFLVGQVAAGRLEYNEERRQEGEPPVGWGDYLTSPHFVEATAENWESEFLQMFVYIVATAYLFQIGSAESRDPRKPPEDETKPRKIPPNAPGPVKRGGWQLKIYEHSLSLAFALLFFFAFALHILGGQRLYNEEREQQGEAAVGVWEYFGSSRFWFESFQNWQSEFLAIGSMVVLSIWLRERNSPESKSVETPHWENEE